ncbi:MAK10-like protein [Tanacetum coccineum]
MGDANPIRTFGDYSKPSHEGYRNTIELLVGNNVVPLRSDTIRLVQNRCSFHGLQFEDPNQHLKDFLKLVDSLDLDGSITTWEDLTTPFHAQFFRPRRTTKLHNDILINAEESWALLEDLALYDKESWNNPRDFAKPVKAVSLPQDVQSTSDHHLIELENQVKCLIEAHLAPTKSTAIEMGNGIEQTEEPKSNLEDEFQDLHLNLPVLEVLAHAPIYNAMLDKYVESLELGENGSAFVQGEVSAKMEDPGLFTLPCRLRDSKPFDTLVDLGSCVNIISLYLFKKLNIRLLEETGHIFGLVDGTKSYPIGIVKDIEVHIGKLKLLNDFYVIDMKKDFKTPLLVERGFLATTNAVIDCRKAKIEVGEGITRLIFRVKGFDLGEEEAPYWNMLGKRESYKP